MYMKVSQYYGLGLTQQSLDFVDIPLDTDIAVFIDPTSITALNSPWGNALASHLQSFFQTVLDHIKNGRHQLARQLLASLSERNEFHLGYSKRRSRGHAIGSKYAELIWTALSSGNAGLTGLLEDIEDTCLFINGIGPDMISDAVCNILRGPLIEYTQDMCTCYGIPTVSGVASGPIWDPHQLKWIDKLVDLPIAGEYGPFVLVPRLLVRFRLSYKADEYYRHYLLPELQDEHFKANSALVRVLKDGTRKRPTKKALIDLYGSDKPSISKQTSPRPQVLEMYRATKKKYPSNPISPEDLSELDNSYTPDWPALRSELLSIPTGNQGATRYEKAIEAIVTALFYPQLTYPFHQSQIHDGRKRIDIQYTNESRKGFFKWISNHYPSSLIFIECKNYGKEIANPELDQLSGRFSPNRGKVGLLISRKVNDKKHLLKRCIDTANDDRGFIIPLDDDDILELMQLKESNSSEVEFDLLRRLFLSLINDNN